MTFSRVSFKPCVCILQDTVLGFHAPIELVAKTNRFCLHKQRAVRSQCCAWGLSLLSLLTRLPQFECSLAGSWALFGIKLKCQINPDCLQKKRNKCVDHFFAQCTLVLTRLEDSLHKSEIFGSLFLLRLLSSNIAMSALGNKSVCLCIVEISGS